MHEYLIEKINWKTISNRIIHKLIELKYNFNNLLRIDFSSSWNVQLSLLILVHLILIDEPTHVFPMKSHRNCFLVTSALTCPILLFTCCVVIYSDLCSAYDNIRWLMAIYCAARDLCNANNIIRWLMATFCADRDLCNANNIIRWLMATYTSYVI